MADGYEPFRPDGANAPGPATRKRAPTLAAEIAAIIRNGLCPRLVQRADGSIELTGLPAEKVVSPDDEAEDLGARMQQIGGVRGGKVRRG